MRGCGESPSCPTLPSVAQDRTNAGPAARPRALRSNRRSRTASARSPGGRRLTGTGSPVGLGRCRWRPLVAGIVGTLSGLQFLGNLRRALHAIERIFRALAALNPEPKDCTHDPQDRIDGAICVSAIAQIVTEPLDRCDRKSIQLVLPKYRQDVLIETRSKVGYMRGTTIGLAAKPV